MEHHDIIIVGAGHGGAQAAIMLRQYGHEGGIAIIGGEPEIPYERPPLSKEYLAGEKPFEKLLIRQADFWKEQGIAMILGDRVTEVHPASKRLILGNGREYSYDKLIWAAGGDPRQLTCPGHDLEGLYAVRTRADVEAIMEKLDKVKHVAVIGGGYIGLEAAAVLRKLGKEVTLLEAMDRVLARVAGPALSKFYEGEHKAQGVDLRTNMTVEAITGVDGHVSGVELSDGTNLSADMVIVGIGVMPCIDILAQAGANINNGAVVDQFCKTSLPDIYAIGDCAAHANRFAGGAVIRLESVQNANDQAITVAKKLTGTLAPYSGTPWFWSTQYDLRLQTIGLSQGFDEEVTRGDPASRKFSVVYLKQGQVIALDCVNNVRDYSHGRKLVETGAKISVEKLANDSVPLKKMIGT